MWGRLAACGGLSTRVQLNEAPHKALTLGAGRHRDQVMPRPSTKMNPALKIAPAAIHPALRRIGASFPSWPPRQRIRSGRLKRPAFAPNVDGSADATT